MAGLRHIFLSFSLVLLLLAGGRAASAAGLVIGVPSWPSAQVTAQIISRIVEQDLGVETELRERGTMLILAEIDSGEIDVHPEIWLPNLEGAVYRYVVERNSLVLAPNPVSADQRICVTDKTVELTGIDEVSDLADPRMASQFDSDGDGLGEMWIGASTWSSTNIELVRARSYGYDRTMTLLQAPEEVAMAAVDVAAAQEQPIVFYCYAPHHVFRLHHIKVLAEPDFDPAAWHIVRPADDPDWLAKSSAGTAWDAGQYQIGYARKLLSEQPAIARLLTNIRFEKEDAVAMSYAVEVERKTPEEVASEWIAANRERVAAWLR